ncbi:SubName: Full=Uncharacterized protein {ECO:0000313/EMBL:CCA75035.1} [Serendipita indica DSM 11827]|uniref:Uncharacterized protein n=1 Tax=Serendipita indica (strain DSM 11827) TaxID=1109443 RepID=G4TUP2_SERID|nr:SubName: Full=Uncharacterized protein {ECO:0000313/EMBL:CCA75035.1} [Serendipita indica DSM 11827]CCA75035.1 hypothetical protein PIIN_09020 [Serendipita indica DSM 11827]
MAPTASSQRPKREQKPKSPSSLKPEGQPKSKPAIAQKAKNRRARKTKAKAKGKGKGKEEDPLGNPPPPPLCFSCSPRPTKAVSPPKTPTRSQPLSPPGLPQLMRRTGQQVPPPTIDPMFEISHTRGVEWSQLLTMCGTLSESLERMYRSYIPHRPDNEDPFVRLRDTLHRENKQGTLTKVTSEALMIVEELWSRRERQWLREGKYIPCGIRIQDNQLNTNDADCYRIIKLLFDQAHTPMGIPEVWKDALRLLGSRELQNHKSEVSLIGREELKPLYWTSPIGAAREPTPWEIVAHLVAASGRSPSWLKEHLVPFVERAQSDQEERRKSHTL